MIASLENSFGYTFLAWCIFFVLTFITAILRLAFNYFSPSEAIKLEVAHLIDPTSFSTVKRTMKENVGYVLAMPFIVLSLPTIIFLSSSIFLGKDFYNLDLLDPLFFMIIIIPASIIMMGLFMPFALIGMMIAFLGISIIIYFGYYIVLGPIYFFTILFGPYRWDKNIIKEVSAYYEHSFVTNINDILFNTWKTLILFLKNRRRLKREKVVSIAVSNPIDKKNALTVFLLTVVCTFLIASIDTNYLFG